MDALSEALRRKIEQLRGGAKPGEMLAQNDPEDMDDDPSQDMDMAPAREDAQLAGPQGDAGMEQMSPQDMKLLEALQMQGAGHKPGSLHHQAGLKAKEHMAMKHKK
jgi:hypothetical protein